MRKFKVSVDLGLVGCTQEAEVEFANEDVPENWQTDRQFQDNMMDVLFNMIEWDIEEITE
ncbi:MAG: hypothetical protein ACR2PW_04625 [Gammaproteobacteria bacterium]